MCVCVAVSCRSFSLLASSVVGVRLLNCLLTGGWGGGPVVSLLLLCVLLNLVTSSESMRSD